MAEKRAFTTHQMGALITMVILAIWGLWVSWLHTTRPLGVVQIEIVFLSALVPVYLVLLPLYALRVRWSYLSGIIAVLGLFAGLTSALVDRAYFFSVSTYNLSTVAVFAFAAACVYLSLRSYLERPSVGWVKGTVGVGLMLGVSVAAVWQVSVHEMQIANYRTKQAIHWVQTRVGDIGPLDDKIEALMTEGAMPSLAAAIVVNDEVVWTRAYGEQDALEKVYDIGSITKPFVATAVLQLYEQGLIDLDGDVNLYLPFSVRHPDYPNVPITVSMLLANRSCLAHNNATYNASLWERNSMGGG